MKQCTSSGIDELAGGELPEGDGIGGRAQRCVMNSDCRA